MTLNGRTALYCTNDASFGAHHEDLKEDRPILSERKKVHGLHFQTVEGSCGYSRGFHGEGPQTTVGWSEPAIFSNFGRHIFRIFTVEAYIITRRP